MIMLALLNVNVADTVVGIIHTDNSTSQADERVRGSRYCILVGVSLRAP